MRRCFLRYDLDAVRVLSLERQAPNAHAINATEWARVDKATFLSRAEKREAVGYGAAAESAGEDAGEDSDAEPEPVISFAPPDSPAGSRPGGASKFNPYHDDLGRFTFAPEGGVDGEDEDGHGEEDNSDDLLRLVSRRRSGPAGTPAQEAQLAIAVSRYRQELGRLRQLDPEWQAPQGVSRGGNIDTIIFDVGARADAARARFDEITRAAIPNTNPLWGVNRLRKELGERGFSFKQRTDSPGFELFNPQTGENVRIMERPARQPHRTEAREKFFFGSYYRYKPTGGSEGSPVPIPD